jgi:hypothetical protein
MHRRYEVRARSRTLVLNFNYGGRNLGSETVPKVALWAADALWEANALAAALALLGVGNIDDDLRPFTLVIRHELVHEGADLKRQ